MYLSIYLSISLSIHIYIYIYIGPRRAPRGRSCAGPARGLNACLFCLSCLNYVSLQVSSYMFLFVYMLLFLA